MKEEEILFFEEVCLEGEKCIGSWRRVWGRRRVVFFFKEDEYFSGLKGIR